ncbi:hypothetical protein PUN28_005320 [Cardiocondyla obscurior]|uniref:Uncharacterized protein n=1 Tax=Cardiocondyla obscurior TaxID=286306 RepID=A0AAW2GH49_9HYME
MKINAHSSLSTDRSTATKFHGIRPSCRVVKCSTLHQSGSESSRTSIRSPFMKLTSVLSRAIRYLRCRLVPKIYQRRYSCRLLQHFPILDHFVPGLPLPRVLRTLYPGDVRGASLHRRVETRHGTGPRADRAGNEAVLSLRAHLRVLSPVRPSPDYRTRRLPAT